MIEERIAERKTAHEAEALKEEADEAEPMKSKDCKCTEECCKTNCVCGTTECKSCASALKQT